LTKNETQKSLKTQTEKVTYNNPLYLFSFGLG
jgi:hypothetical protein